MSSSIGTVTLPDGVKIAYRLTERSQPLVSGLVVIVHGRLDSKDTGPLAFIDSHLNEFNLLEFDARGMGESEGVTTYRGAPEEAVDLKHLIDHFISLGHSIHCIIGHSRGCSVAGCYARLYDGHAPCKHFVLVSGRFDATGAPTSRFSKQQMQQLEEKGSFVWCQYTAGPYPERPLRRDYVIHRADVELAQGTNEMHTWKDLDENSRVLVIHGTDDGSVPVSNAHQTVAAVRKGPALCDLMLFDGVAHFFEKPGEGELLGDTITRWLSWRHRFPGKRTPLFDSGTAVASKIVTGSLGEKGNSQM